MALGQGMSCDQPNAASLAGVTVELTVLSRVAYRGKEITGPRLRGLLALLAGEPNGCSTSRLVDGLWPDDQPDNPTKALQILVSRIRAQLGDGPHRPHADRLPARARRGAGRRVRRAPARRRGRASTRGPATTHRRIEDAEAGLALWDGPPKPDENRDPLADLRAERAVTYRTLVRAARTGARPARPARARPSGRSPTWPPSTRATRRSSLELIRAEASRRSRRPRR